MTKLTYTRYFGFGLDDLSAAFLWFCMSLLKSYQPSFLPHLFWFLESNYCFYQSLLSLINILMKQIFDLYLAFYGLCLIQRDSKICALHENCSNISMQIEQSIFTTFSCIETWSGLCLAFMWPFMIFWVSLKACRLTID